MSTPAASAALPLPKGSACGKDSEQHMRIWRRVDTAAQGGPWVCGLCHPPVKGCHVEWTDGTTEVIGAESPAVPVIADEAPAADPLTGEAAATAAEAQPEVSAPGLPVEATAAPTVAVEAPVPPPPAAVGEAPAPEAPPAPAGAAPAPVAAEDGEVSLDSAIARHGDAHLCEIEGEGWIVCPDDDCDRPDHDCRVQRAYALDAAA